MVHRNSQAVQKIALDRNETFVCLKRNLSAVGYMLTNPWIHSHKLGYLQRKFIYLFISKTVVPGVWGVTVPLVKKHQTFESQKFSLCEIKTNTWVNLTGPLQIVNHRCVGYNARKKKYFKTASIRIQFKISFMLGSRFSKLEI